ncbi:unnamed protein product [Rotaria sordida]|uniref:Ubiquitin-like protease family profile domain-containing protein n=1 Tax=Rotaria sordida TaxID=392033 RepID=A0A818PCS9_9BILA|nr:unnamed protein product [Rotaria sordida]CAF3621286.1 unnamed protein product [Rotaria sordida]CAF3629297.1 unnamed protein product [Rotaria sordida]
MSSSLESDPILVSYQDSIVRLSNLKTLDDSNWLDDNIITFAFEYLQYESKFTNDMKNFFVFVTPPVVQLLKMSDNLFAEQLLQSIDFLEKKFLILPINDNTRVTVFGGSHWSLLILSIQEKILYHFDSMSLLNDHTAKEVQQKFQAFFHDDHITLINCRCPQQKNGFDCGLYVIVIVEEFCRFIYEYYSLKNSNKDKYDKDLFEKFMNEINQCISSEYINQRRKQLKTLLESMSINRKK